MKQPVTEVSGSHQSVERALQALQLLAEGPLRVGQLAESLGLGQSTVSRLMLTMERAGFTSRGANGCYELGPSVLRLGGAAANQSRIHRASRVLAVNLSQEHGVGFNVAVRAGNQIQYLVSLQGGDQVLPITRLGMYGPLHATAMGKSLLLGVPPQMWKELAEPLTRYTANTVSTMEELGAQLDEASRRGYTTEIEELALGRACVAAQVRDDSGRVVAAVSVSGPMSFMNPRQRAAEWGGIVIEAADSISTNLGFLAPKGFTP